MFKTEFLSVYRFKAEKEGTVIKGQDGLVAGGSNCVPFSQQRAATLSSRLLGGQIVKKRKNIWRILGLN